MMQRINVRAAMWTCLCWCILGGLVEAVGAQDRGTVDRNSQVSLPPATIPVTYPAVSVADDVFVDQSSEPMVIGARGERQSFRASDSLLRVGGSMVIVIGLLLVGVWVMRNLGAGATAGHPAETLRVVRRMKVAGRSYVNAIQFGDRLLLVGDGPAGLRTLAEVSDPHEVQELLTRLGVAASARRAPETTRVNSTTGTYSPTEQELREWIQRDRLVRS
jgi:flagellar biogenesis protein FliO